MRRLLLIELPSLANMNLYRLGIRTRLHAILFGEHCPACGRKALLKDGGYDWPELFKQWELTPEWAEAFRGRESVSCASCGANLRGRHLARVLTEVLGARTGRRFRSLADACQSPEVSSLLVAEINAAEGLHSFLLRLPNLSYSEYGSERSEDLARLSYSDSSFDLVITSDSLEHVPDVRVALREIHRVLRPGGLHVTAFVAAARRWTEAS